MNLSIVGRTFYLANPVAGRLGFSDSFRKILEDLGTKLVIKFENKETYEHLKSSPVLLISNHPFMFGIVALIASLPSRNNSYLIINSDYSNVYDNLDKFLIPVYIRHESYGNWYERLLAIILRESNNIYSKISKKEHNKNIQSIYETRNKIKLGGLVIIFPERREREKPWYEGVGFLLKGADKQAKQNVIFAYIGGGSRRLDYLRLIPYFGRFLRPISINFSAPITLSKVLSEYRDPKKIAQILQNEYKMWSRSLE